jgi:lipid II:glycine glycyltransferase (peptidoglycan interpeptide bridge formation enzyme)
VNSNALTAGLEFSIAVDQATEGEWNKLVSLFEDASVYQAWAYGEVHWGRSQLSHLVLTQKGAVVAAAQVRIVRLPVLGKGVAYVRWGPLCCRRGGERDPKVFRRVVQELVDEYIRKRGLLLRIIPSAYSTDPCANSVRSTLAELGFAQDPTDPVYHTMRLDLSASVEELRMGWRPRWRNKLKHAENAGFAVTLGTETARYTRFLDAYREMMARKRFRTTVDVYEFGRLQAALSEPFKMQILLCEKDGVLFNALVVAPAGNTGIYLLAATSDEGLKADGAFLLQWRAIQFLKEHGYRWYDLGGINPHRNPGVYQFKSGMGGADTLQLGCFECRANRMSSLCVGAAEALMAMVGRVAALIAKSRSAKPSATAAPAQE